MKKMESAYGLEFPKGASARVTEQANAYINKYSFKELGNVAKLHFKTTNGLIKN